MRPYRFVPAMAVGKGRADSWLASWHAWLASAPMIHTSLHDLGPAGFVRWHHCDPVSLHGNPKWRPAQRFEIAWRIQNAIN